MKKALLLGTSMLVATAMAAPTVMAQDTEVEAADREVIVVTAGKREQTLQEVPIAVSVVDGQAIEQAKIDDLIDLQSLVPSLRVGQLQSSANTTFIIRGFGNGANNVGIEPSVGVFIDGVYRSRSASAISDLPNLERVEVLRGPQSTLFGKNASAGVISLVTAAPEYEFGAWAEATVGNLGLYQFRGDVTGGITDNLAFRFYASTTQRDGYFETSGASGLEDHNDRNRWAVRGQLLWEPTENISFRAIGDYDEIDENCCGVANLVDGPTGAAIRGLGGDLFGEDPFGRRQELNFNSTNEVQNGGLSLQGDFEFDGFAVTSITAYRERTLFTDQDSDFTSADLIGSNVLDEEVNTFTQELRITSTGDNVIDWLIGGFYFDEEVNLLEQELTYGADFRAYADFLTGGGYTGIEPLLGFPAGTFGAEGQGRTLAAGQENQSWSIFGQLDWNITDRLTLTGGFNYTQDEKDVFHGQTTTDVFSLLDFEQIGTGLIFNGLTGLAPTPQNFALVPDAFAAAQGLSTVPCTPQNFPACNELLALQPLQFLPAVTPFPNPVENGRSEDDKFTWTARVAYDLTDNINVYASAATGFKASSWNLSPDTRPLPGDLAELEAQGLATPNLVSGTRFAGPEEATVYEIGMKAQFDTVAFNLTLFDQTLEGFQSNIFQGTGFVLANAGETSVQGVEFDASWDPIPELALTAAVTWLDPVYDSFENAQGPNGVTDLSGERPAGIPEWSLSLSATYTKQFDEYIGFLRADYQYESEVTTADNLSPEFASRQVDLFNASAGLSPVDGFWDLQLWGRNIFNDDYLIQAFPSVAQAGSFSGYPNQPRTYGATLRLTY